MFCCYARIIESYRVPGKKYPKVRILQNLGRYVELEARTRHRRTPDEGASTATRNGKGSPAEFCFAKYLNVLEEVYRASSEGFPLVNYGGKYTPGFGTTCRRRESRMLLEVLM